MPNINLIAVRRVDKKKLERITRQLFFGVAAEVVALVLLCSFIGARHMALKGALSDADARIQRLQPTLDRIAQIEKEMDVLRPKLETLEAAREETQRWRAMLQIVSQSVPANAWLASLSSTAVEGDTTLTLTGATASQTLVGETMTRLGSFPVFDNVELRFSQMAPSQDDQGPRFNFEIGAHLKPTRAAEEAKAKKAAEEAAKSSTKEASAATAGGSPNGRRSA